MSSSQELDDFEIIDFADIAKGLVADDPPDIAKITAWLKPTDYNAASGEFRRHLSSQSPGTGEWIRETAQFKQWISSKNQSSIWIKAVPGAGKSVVAASMIDSFTRNENFPILFFFFRQIIESNRTAISLLRDWIAQLLDSSEVLQAALWHLAKEDAEFGSLSQAQLWQYLRSGLREVDRAYLVVDALDEMNIDEEFLGQLNNLGLFRPAHIKILMTSRSKQYLQRALKDPKVIHVALEEELVQRDIAHFVRQRAASLGNHGVDKETQQLIHDIVLQRSQRLFLYARLMLNQIDDSVIGRVQDQASIKDMIAKLPVGLEDMYNHILYDHATLAGVEQKTQLLILSLVIQSARPLRLIEVAHALGPDHCGNRNPKEIVRGACGPLLEIMEDESIQIIHHSFTEFLLDTSRSQRATENSTKFPVLDAIACNIEIALTCLNYLQFRCLNDDDLKNKQDNSESDSNDFGMFGDSKIPKMLRKINPLHFPFFEYSIAHWPYHAAKCRTIDEHLFNALNEFWVPKNPYDRFWMLRREEGDDWTYRRPNGNTTPLHVAAKFNMFSWASTLIHNEPNVDVLDDAKCSPLHWAARSGNVEMVELLLKAGAQPDLDRVDGLKPLHLSAKRNHYKVVRLLLQAGKYFLDLI
jgi:hypothetical protein